VANYLGLDGFRFGWVAAWIDEAGDHGFDYSPGLTRLLTMPHERAMIDMPIGLPTEGYRGCDLHARELIGAAVFVGARRNLWEFQGPDEANRYYWDHEGEGRGISRQLWNIRDKIREVDEFMTPERQKTIGEAHPELIFWNLSGRQKLDRKTTARGREQRIELLVARGFAKLPRWLTLRHGTGIGRDDLIDACACAIAARDSRESVAGDELDPRGLRMAINY
jgi:predicted RNase H-like nuclease